MLYLLSGSEQDRYNTRMSELTKTGRPRNAGMFEPGRSGNPSGRPKADVKLRDLAQEQTEAAMKTLVEIMKDEKASHSARTAAANAVLDRGHGKPVQSNENRNVDLT